MRDSYDRFFKNFKISSKDLVEYGISNVKFKKFEHIVSEELSKINIDICE